MNGKFVGKMELEGEDDGDWSEEKLRERVAKSGVRGKEKVEQARRVVVLREKRIVNFIVI